MSIFSLLFGQKGNDITPQRRDAGNYAIVDAEVSLKDNRVHDIGAWRHDGAVFHKASKTELTDFLQGEDFVCGHNIVHHDAKHLFPNGKYRWVLVDTLYMSPLLFPERPYHKLVKDDKLITDQLNNPVNDCEKARELLLDEIARWNELPQQRQEIFTLLLSGKEEFDGFLQMTGAWESYNGDGSATANATGYKRSTAESANGQRLAYLIRSEYEGRICANADITAIATQHPCALAYALALVDTTDYRSVTPSWVLYNFPEVEFVIDQLRHRRCTEGCGYCKQAFDIHVNLKKFFGYDAFRTYDGEPLQENAVRAAADGKSLLAIFPTGGGKSLTFQLPALMDGRSVHGLTVVISPLQSLMKDQVDNLAERGITDAVTINGLLDPISRSHAIERVQSGDASLLYIAPEMLRSTTIERLLMSRHIVRFVIDEAHCFSAWGHDFRVDYLYIGKFIKQYQENKYHKTRIPVSCFTATAKQKVVQDISDYFKQWLDADLQLFASSASRTNLRYSVIHLDTDEEKYSRLRSLITESQCPTIVYVSRTKRTKELAASLTRDGMPALPYNGKMNADEKIKNQEAFMEGRVDIVVATSAFGMGVDKSDVGLVVHYDISDSLENYVQEAGRAGRDPNLSARCFVLYSDNDLDKHFILLNQTKLSLSEIQQVWQAVKAFTRQRPHTCCSALEIARQAGWDDSVPDIETRVRTALAALEQSGYIERGNNVPHVYATGITVKNMDEARRRIAHSALFDSEEVEKAVRIIKSLISQKYTDRAQDAEAESRIDYLADILGMKKGEVISAVGRMRQEGILADSKDISAYMQDVGTERKTIQTIEYFGRLEEYILKEIPDDKLYTSYKQLNDNAIRTGHDKSTDKNIRTLIFFLSIKGYIRKEGNGLQSMTISRQNDMETTMKRFEKRLETCLFTIKWLYRQAEEAKVEVGKGSAVQFSIVELYQEMQKQQSMFHYTDSLKMEEVEEALLYMSKIGALKLEGGFLVLYNTMTIRRLKDNRLRYKIDDYRLLNEFYRQKIQQIHIVGEYANLMVKDYNAALNFVHDYFNMDYQQFIRNYFKGERIKEIERNLTPAKYRQLFAELSQTQKSIIDDNTSHCIVVAAGPGSGKTRVLVHKLASLLLLEDVKHEQLLMLTFSRAAATEFKQRLMQLIGNAAHFVEIKTFHSYCFDLLGRIGNLDDVNRVVAKAAEMIEHGEVEKSRIGKTVLVIDEAQDMNADACRLVKALMQNNEDMRVIAVGDDDQCIFQFAGADSKYMQQLMQDSDARFTEMTENYRSARHIVDSANSFVKKLGSRLKSEPIRAMSQADGFVLLTHHCSPHMFQPIAEEIENSNRKGTSCVLTQTNNEALTMVALLHRHGVKAKLVQTMGDMKFCNIAEMKFFMKLIKKNNNSHIITEEAWEEAKKQTFSKYDTSTTLPFIRRCIETFEQTNRTKYYSDFYEYVLESSVEDFCDLSDADVVVSTIHKAKGREFDNVYMLIGKNANLTEETLCCYYVGITRAKHYLSIHTTESVFRGMFADSRIDCKEPYSMPDEIALQLTHKNVNLGFFKNCKKEVLALRGGDDLIYDRYALRSAQTGRTVAEMSQKMKEELYTWAQKGYHVSSAKARFIVAWKPKDAPKDEKYTAVLLADLTLKR